MRITKTGHVIKSEEIDALAENPDKNIVALRRKYLATEDEQQNIEDTELLSRTYSGISQLGLRQLMQVWNPRIPFSLRERTLQAIRALSDSLSAELAREVVKAAGEHDTFEAFIRTILPLIEADYNRVTNYVQWQDTSLRQYLALIDDPSYTTGLFVSELGETTCLRCSQHHGRLFSRLEMENLDIIHPLHSNCRCQFVLMDNAAGYIYNLNRAVFMEQLESALADIGGLRGGVFQLNHSFTSVGINRSTLRKLELPDVPVIADTADWQERFGAWARKFCGDLADLLDAFFGRGEMILERMVEAEGLMQFVHAADYLTLGIGSALIEGTIDRYDIYEEDTRLYNRLNLITLGTVEMAEGAVNPDEPWSLEHLLDIVGTVTLIYGAAKGLKSALGPDDFVDDAARAARDTLDDALRALDDIADDTLDDTARAAHEAALRQIDDALATLAKEDGIVTKIMSADDLNAAQIAKGDYASHLPNSNAYQIRLADEGNYVRVFSGNGSQTGSWLMKADDIAGLTAEQIKNKFALEYLPEYICDVNVPVGTDLYVSVANEIFTWGAGGGVQYRIVDRWLDDWFSNIRTLP